MLSSDGYVCLPEKDAARGRAREAQDGSAASSYRRALDGERDDLTALLQKQQSHDDRTGQRAALGERRTGLALSSP